MTRIQNVRLTSSENAKRLLRKNHAAFKALLQLQNGQNFVLTLAIYHKILPKNTLIFAYALPELRTRTTRSKLPNENQNKRLGPNKFCFESTFSTLTSKVIISQRPKYHRIEKPEHVYTSKTKIYDGNRWAYIFKI